MSRFHVALGCLAALVVGLGCGTSTEDRTSGDGALSEPPLFATLAPDSTGITFSNVLTETQAFNVFTYRNFFNGGGVGIGDFNGDERPDVYFNANQGPNALYLNQTEPGGPIQFDDVTEIAGVGGARAWSTGVSVVDLNADGLLDLYVCNAGNLEGDDKQNELFINEGLGDDGVPRFTEQAEAYGLADEGYTTHAAFFDYDRDGDLDAYLLNNSFRPVSSFGLRNIRHIRDDLGGDKLMRNDSEPNAPRFTDVSEEAGIFGSEIAFGLGVTAGDVDDDGWTDLYISNDFFERDYLYLNNQDGTFREVLDEAMPLLSLSSMGADMADLNGDGRPEIYVTDMFPEDDRRLKLTSAYEGYNLYQAKVANDYHHQVMRNTLQRNNGDGTFSEVGQIAGVSATDWSWGALFADLDGDGHKDLYVANGVYRDVTDQDYINFLADEETRERVAAGVETGEGVDFLALTSEIPTTPIRNYAFRNDGATDGLRFTDATTAWGLAEPGYSNGAAYGDLDGDGDLDLVVNNLGAPASLYENLSDAQLRHQYLQVRLVGPSANRFGIGAKVGVWTSGRASYLEQIPMRGFQSSMDYTLTFGLGSAAIVDSVTVRWPDGRQQSLRNVTTGQVLTLRHEDERLQTSEPAGLPAAQSALLRDVTATAVLPYRHDESRFVDFHRESLLPKKLSTEGPAAASGDVNGDGLDDLYLGGAAGQPGVLLVQTARGAFEPANPSAFETDAASEDTDAAFFDADGDGDLDLYVVSGSNEFAVNDLALVDRLYLGDGSGGFDRGEGMLPTQFSSGSTVAPADFDGDGDVDLFVGARSVPYRYGVVPRSALLLNNGRGRFSDITERRAPGLVEAGLVTDATWTDTDGDGDLDLVAVGEWMPVRVFENAGDGTLNAADVPGLDATEGWWTRIEAADLDGDGDEDLVVGNLGLNTKLRATPERPVTMHVADFDSNGSTEQLLSLYPPGSDTAYPFTLRKDLVRQLPHLKRRYPRFEGYAEQTVEDIFTTEELASAEVRTATTFASSVFMNEGGAFVRRALPYDAQLAPVYGLLADDLDGDGSTDLLLAGNFYDVRPDLGRMAASYGLALRGRGDGTFDSLWPRKSGFFVPGQTRRLVSARTSNGVRVVAAKNDAAPQVFSLIPNG
ncbi:MAG: VCBS repeat-containing protein [Bacteroidota bacterium]